MDRIFFAFMLISIGFLGQEVMVSAIFECYFWRNIKYSTINWTHGIIFQDTMIPNFHPSNSNQTFNSHIQDKCTYPTHCARVSLSVTHTTAVTLDYTSQKEKRSKAVAQCSVSWPTIKGNRNAQKVRVGIRSAYPIFKLVANYLKPIASLSCVV